MKIIINPNLQTQSSTSDSSLDSPVITRPRPFGSAYNRTSHETGVFLTPGGGTGVVHGKRTSPPSSPESLDRLFYEAFAANSSINRDLSNASLPVETNEQSLTQTPVTHGKNDSFNQSVETKMQYPPLPQNANFSSSSSIKKSWFQRAKERASKTWAAVKKARPKQVAKVILGVILAPVAGASLVAREAISAVQNLLFYAIPLTNKIGDNKKLGRFVKLCIGVILLPAALVSVTVTFILAIPLTIAKEIVGFPSELYFKNLLGTKKMPGLFTHGGYLDLLTP